MDDKCMHLTNYSINKRSGSFEKNDDTEGSSGSKRSIAWLLSWLSEERGPSVTEKLWNQIGEICVKTIISIAPILEREYNITFGLNQITNQDSVGGTKHSDCSTWPDNMKASNKENSSDTSNSNPVLPENTNTTKELPTIKELKGSRCFAILGFDIMIDSKIKPYLIEVNHLPSFGTDSPLDNDIKSKVIHQALSAVKVDSSDKRTYEQGQKMRARRRLLEKCRRQSAQNSSRRGAIEDYTNIKEVEKYVEQIYATYAPEKVDKVQEILKKYKGYEEWLVQRIHEKYCSAKTEDDNNEDTDTDSDDESIHDMFNFRPGECDEDLANEERILKDFERIYPPKPYHFNHPPYEDMKKHAFEEDLKHQVRLTCPLWQVRQNEDGDILETYEVHEGRDGAHHKYSRGDWLINGNIHLKKKESVPIKLLKPPTEKQIEAAERLSRGFSVDRTSAQRSKLRASSCVMTGNDFISRFSRIEEENREIRRRNGEKFNERSQLMMRPIQIEFDENTEYQYGDGNRYYVDFVGRKLAMNL